MDLELYPFQKDTVEQAKKFLSTRRCVYIANEQGTGKTPVALSLVNTLEHTRVLIVCPSVMKYIWRDEIYRWCRRGINSLPVVQVIDNSHDSFNSSATFTIISYEMTWRYAPIKEREFDILIADEAHYLKNSSAKRTRYFFQTLFKNSHYRILLSGTPMTKNVVDLYPPLHHMIPEEQTFQSFQDFANEYSYSRPTDWGVSYYGLKNHEKLSKIMRSNVYIRYRKDQVLTQLPPKVYQKVSLPSSLAVQVKDAAADQSYKSVIADLSSGSHGPSRPKNLSEHRRLQGEAKIDAVAEYAKELLEQEIPIVIFAHHQNVIFGLRDKLESYHPLVITGDTPARDRAEYVKKFQDGDTNLIIGNFQAAGTGITLTRASNVLLAELDWIPAVMAQAIDRTHRIGQTASQVIIHYFCVEDSLDETINNLLIRRTKEITKVLDTPTIPALSAEQAN